MFPDLHEELALRAAGYARVAGVDEAGRGAWAGPVCAAAVFLPLDRTDLADLLTGVRDSKQLSPTQRESLLPLILQVAEATGVGWATPAEVDEAGILPATRRAMARAVAQLDGQVDALLVDYVHLPDLDLPQRALPKADVRCLSVAAASVVAKVERDRLMVALDQDFPGYGFAHHKGYGTRQHREALERLGPSPIHRKSWRPVRGLTSHKRKEQPVTEQPPYTDVGFTIVVRVIQQEGYCAAGHQVGDEVIFNGQTVQGKVCLHALYSFLPKVFAMRYGAEFPWLDDKDVATHACPDAWNPVVFEIRRVK